MDEAERWLTLAILDHAVWSSKAHQRSDRSAYRTAVVEVFGEGIADWTRQHAATLCLALKTVGETLFCYTDAPDTVIDALKEVPALRYVHGRPTSKMSFSN